ncbi:di/tricarboxylate transporter [Pontibacter ummariensis]|uniref:Di- and tricarboxylate transporter n=1 Tax=Pontibacter ummariensis TaxID=1610492 RepID=A0A239EIM4_9BACT|nr:SLC13 family permease [Pontibacter ummariensis]PRY13282.1 di/tricarboxylate transporter [Pontibacter ummariensis]SNS44515.1 Di- and tricarboxylate transporter [Pontibacter ummariensis]
MSGLPVGEWITMLVLVWCVAGLLTGRLRPSVVFLSAVVVLMLARVVQPEDFLESLSNQSIVTIFLLIFITAGIKEHFNLIGFLNRLFKSARSPRSFMVRMTTGVSLLSSVVNNTPIVALMIPYVYQWSKRHKVAPSKLLLPLSFSAMVGGMMTIIGTSTNLVLNGFILTKEPEGLDFLDFLLPGALVTTVGLVFLSTIGYKLLPSRVNPLDEFKTNARQYLVETLIEDGSVLAGKTITEANLRNLEGIYLFEIVRKGKIISPVTPGEVLQVGDHLYFAGDTEKVVELLQQDNGLQIPHSERLGIGQHVDLVETVVPRNSDLTGRTLKESQFREKHDAAVVAIHRNGENLRGKIGAIVLEPGDLLLLSAGQKFLTRNKNNRDLYTVSVVYRSNGAATWKKMVFLVGALLSIGLMAAGAFNLFFSLFLVSVLMALTGLLRAGDIKKLLDLDLLIVLGGALTLSKALIDTGVAQEMASLFIAFFEDWGKYGILIGLYLITVLLTSFLTNVAAVSIVFPIAYSLSHGMGLDPTGFYVAIAFGASASFITPVGYQTNLMIYGPGSYKSGDFIKIGVPFTLLYSITCMSYIILTYF